MATPSKGLDRRAERTRALIRQAFIEIASENRLSSISVQDITDRANISRGTFYAHYADKYDLIDVIMREDFQRMVIGLSLPPVLDKDALHSLIQGVLQYFETVFQRHQRERDLAPYLEKAIHIELYAVIRDGLERGPSSDGIAHEMLAQMMSWAIFGAAVQWSRAHLPASVEQAAEQILGVILDGAAVHLRANFEDK